MAPSIILVTLCHLHQAIINKMVPFGWPFCSRYDCKPSLQAAHEVQKLLPLACDLQETSLCAQKWLFLIPSKNTCTTGLKVWVLSSSPGYSRGGLSNAFGKHY